MPLLDSSISDGKNMFEVNVWGVFAVTQAFSPMLIAARGKILNIGSGAGLVPVPFMGKSVDVLGRALSALQRPDYSTRNV